MVCLSYRDVWAFARIAQHVDMYGNLSSCVYLSSLSNPFLILSPLSIYITIFLSLHCPPFYSLSLFFSSTLPSPLTRLSEKIHRVDEFQLEHNNTRLGARRQ